MAAWLQKRLKDAEALLEQADRTAQRVVVKDQDQDKPRNPQSVGVFPSVQSSTSTGSNTNTRSDVSKALQAAGKPQEAHTFSKGQNLTAVKPSLQPPSVSTSGHPAQIPFSPLPVAARLPPVNISSQSKVAPVAQAKPPPTGAEQIPFMTSAVASQPQQSDDNNSMVSTLKQVSPQAEADSRSTSPGAVDSTAEQSQQAETSMGSDDHGIANNGKSPKAIEQTVSVSPSNEPAAQSVEAEGSLMPVDTTNSVAADASDDLQQPETDGDIVQNAAGAVVDTASVDSKQRLTESDQSTVMQEAQMQAASRSGKQVTPFSSQAGMDNLVTASGDIMQSEAQISELQLPFQIVQPSEAAAAVASSSDSAQMQSQTSLPVDSNARAAAVAEAIKRAAQVSGGGQPYAQGVDQGAAGREALLSRLVEQLKGRLQALKEENQQLEDMLHQSDTRASGSVRDVDRLEDAVSKAEAGRMSAEAALAHRSAMQHGELQTAHQALQAATKQLQDCQARLADLENTNTLLIQEQQVSEGRIIAALRDEATAAEMRLEEERAAHTNTQRTAAAREQALQSSMADGGSALAGMQRLVEDRTQQASAAQQALMQLQQEHAQLAAHMRNAQDQAAARQTSGSVEAQTQLQAEADRWQQESAQAGESLRTAQAACEQAEAQVESLQGTVRDLQRHVQDRGGYDELQARFKEVTELLYTKQTQLERMAAEKAAQQLAHEREVAHAKDDAERVKRRVKSERVSASFANTMDDVVVPMDSLGEAFDRLANDNRVGSYVKAGARALDTSAAAAVRLIKQYPLGRLFIFLYIIGIHLFIYILISRLQGQALGHLHHAATTMEDLNSRM